MEMLHPMTNVKIKKLQKKGFVLYHKLTLEIAILLNIINIQHIIS